MARDFYYDLEAGVTEFGNQTIQRGDNEYFEIQPTTEEIDDLNQEPIITDPRTNKVWGLYTEEEINNEAIELASLSTIFGREPVDVSHLRPAFDKAIEMNPELQQDKDSLLELGLASVKLGYLQHRKNFHIWDRDKRDVVGADLDIQRITGEIEELYQKHPDLMGIHPVKGFFSETLKFTGQSGAALQYGWDRWKVAAPAHMMLGQPVPAAYGEIMSEMEGAADQIDPEYAKEAASKYSIPFAASEFAGLAGLFIPGGLVLKTFGGGAIKGFKILSALAGMTGAGVTESATEAMQTIISNVAKYEALQRSQIDRGEEPYFPTGEELTEGMSEAAIAAFQGAFGLKFGGSVISPAVGKLSKGTRDKVSKKVAERKIEIGKQVQEAKRKVEQEKRVEVNEKKQKPVAETNPIEPDQSAEAVAAPVAEGTNITEGDLDALIIADVEDRADIVSEVTGRAVEGVEAEALFGYHLRVALDGNEEQAQAVESVLRARAGNLGMSLDEYLEARKLKLDVVDEDTGAIGQTGQVVFKEHETIITAFRQTTIEDMAHEIGHVFRRDLSDQQRTEAERIFNVKGGQWTRENEEAFANAWVQYLQEGRAPTQEMQSLFEKFTQWMKRTYTALRNSPTAGIGISNEARSLFDSLLVADQEGKLNLAPGTSLVDELYQGAYHGTHARGIEQFSTDYIGTGEGAQAYGWGLYFSSKKEIAEWYRKNLSHAVAKIAGKVYDYTGKDYENTAINFFVNYGGDIDAAIQDLLKQVATMRDGTSPWVHLFDPLKAIEVTEEYDKAAEFLEQNRGKLAYEEQVGQLYEVDVPEDGELLDFSKPIDQQPEQVEQALEQIWPFLQAGMQNIDKELAWGSDIYRALTEAFGIPEQFGGLKEQLNGRTRKQATSEYLRSIGIKGHKYIGTTSDETNYVIYEGESVDILDTLYSIPPEDRAEAAVGKARTERRRTKTKAGVQKRRAKGEAVQRVADVLKQGYQAVQTGVQTPEQAVLMQLHALADVAQQALDKGDKIGMAKAKADMKVVLAQWKAAQVYKNRVKDISSRIETFIKKYKPKRLKPKRMSKRKLRSQFQKEVTEFVQTLHPRISSINKLRGKGQLTDALLSRQLLNDDLFGSRNGVAFADAGSVSELVSYWETKYIGIMLRAVDPQTAPQAIKELQQFQKDLQAWLVDRKQEGPLSANKLLAAEITDQSMQAITGMDTEQVETELEEVSAEEYHVQDRLAKWRFPSRKNLQDLIARNTVGKYAFLNPRSIVNAITSYEPLNSESPIKKVFDFFEARQKLESWLREDQKLLDSAYMQIYELSTGYSRNSKMARDAVRSIKIEGFRQRWSIAGIRDLYMKAQDPSLAERLEKQGLGPAVRRRIFRAHLTPKDKMFADWQLQFYNEDARYDRYNSVYVQLNGVDLPRYTNYSPIDVEGFRERAHDEDTAMVVSQHHLDNVVRATAEGARSLIPRTEQNNSIKRSRIKFENDVSNFFVYIEQMNHFAAYAEQVRLAKAVMNNQNFRDGVTMQYGRKILTKLDDHLNNLATNGKNQSGVVKEVDRVRTGFVSAMVSANMGATLKQQISVVNFWQSMTVGEYLQSWVEFAKNPKQAVKEMWDMAAHHPFFLNRRQAIDRDLKAVSRTTDFSRWRANPSLTNFFSLPVRLSDNAAIALGGWFLVKKFQRQGMSHDEAVNAMVRLADRTQQSAAMEEQSLLQQGHSFVRLATPFSTGPVQATRQELDATRAFAAGQMPFKQWAKTMAIYHIIVPTMYAMAAEWIQQDEGEDWEWGEFFKSHWATYALGPWGASYEIGRLMTNQARYILGQRYYQDNTMTAQLAQDVSKVLKYVRAGDTDELTLDDWAAFAQALNIGAGAFTGGGKVPIQRLTRIAQGMAEGDIKQATFGTKPD